MQTTVETTEPHTVKLTIEVPADRVDADLDQTYRAIAREVKIPGFRPGKAPRAIIDAQIGRDVVLEEYVSATLPTYFRTAVTDEDLAPIGEPDVDVEQLEPGKALIFTATVEVRPRLTFEPSDYEGLQVKRPATVVSEDEIDVWVERLRRQFGELEPVERPSAEGDFVTATVNVSRDGEDLEALAREDHLIAIGSGEFGEEFDAQLTGSKGGDILAFEGVLPDRFGDDLGGVQVSFRVLVKDVKALELPEVDDGFAKTASEFDTIDELRADLRDKIHEAKEREAAGAVRDRVLQALVDRVEVDLPDSLVEQETAHRIQHAEERAARYGITLDQMLELQGWDRARLAEDSRDHAIRAIQADLALEAVARAADVQVDADELGAEISSLAQAYGRDAKELAKQLDRSGQIVTLAGDIIRTKALDLVVENADITDETPEETEAAKAEAAEESEETTT
jgi:trigger factor